MIVSLHALSPAPAGADNAELRLVWSDGSSSTLPMQRWLGAPTVEEIEVLGLAVAPVLDIGCGPGRHVAALNRHCVMAMGIDVADGAVSHARRRGAPVLQRSIFERVPGSGRWNSALLLDGNIGIGGDPHRLLHRLSQVLHPKGNVIVEMEAPGVASRKSSATLQCDGATTEPFPWAIVGVTDIERLAHEADWCTHDLFTGGGRWFADLRRDVGAGRPTA